MLVACPSLWATPCRMRWLAWSGMNQSTSAGPRPRPPSAAAASTASAILTTAGREDSVDRSSADGPIGLGRGRPAVDVEQILLAAVARAGRSPGGRGRRSSPALRPAPAPPRRPRRRTARRCRDRCSRAVWSWSLPRSPGRSGHGRGRRSRRRPTGRRRSRSRPPARSKAGQNRQRPACAGRWRPWRERSGSGVAATTTIEVHVGWQCGPAAFRAARRGLRRRGPEVI